MLYKECKMQNISFPAVFESLTDGYSIYFPDLPGCISWGKNIEEAKLQAKDALELHIFGMEESGEKIPIPSEIVSATNEDDVVVTITAFPDSFRQNHEAMQLKAAAI